MPRPSTIVVQVKPELDEEALAELREKLSEALRVGKTQILPPGPLPGRWEITVPAGPDFAAFAAGALRIAARRWTGPSRDMLNRLADALDHATYGGDPQGDTQP